MPYCIYQTIAPNTHRCIDCGNTQTTHFPPHKIHAVCIGTMERTGSPGDELAAIFDDIDVHEQSGCSCPVLKEAMNRWGAEGCRVHRGHIVTSLNENANNYGLLTKVSAGWKLKDEPWFKVSDPYGSLVDEAIRRAAISRPTSPHPESPEAKRQ